MADNRKTEYDDYQIDPEKHFLTVDVGGKEFEQVIVCPVCGFEYNHFGKPILESGNDSYEASWNGRGDLISINFECEQSHKWTMCFGFHKGNTFIFLRNLKQKEL